MSRFCFAARTICAWLLAALAGAAIAGEPAIRIVTE
jgi:hypothetical protein